MTTASIPDLWPADFGVSNDPSPLAILRQQGLKLGEKTRNAVFGEVDSSSDKSSSRFQHTLFVSAPFLDVRHPILTASHGIERYPVETTRPVRGGYKSLKKVSKDAKEFAEVLKGILAEGHTVALIRSLISQLQDIEEEQLE